MHENTLEKRNWKTKKSTFVISLGGNKIPFIFEKKEKYPIEAFKGHYYSEGKWYNFSSKSSDLERILLFFNSKWQKVALMKENNDEVPIDIFLCFWKEKITESKKILLLQRNSEKDEFDICYMDIFGLNDMNMKFLKILFEDMIPKIFGDKMLACNGDNIPILGMNDYMDES